MDSKPIDRDAIPPPDDEEAVGMRHVADRSVPRTAASGAAVHAWLERHPEDVILPGDEERYALYLKGPTGFSA